MLAKSLLSPPLCPQSWANSPPNRIGALEPVGVGHQRQSLQCHAFEAQSCALTLVAHPQTPAFCNSSVHDSLGFVEQQHILSPSKKVQSARAIANNSGSVLTLATFLAGVGIGSIAYGSWIATRSSSIDVEQLCAADGLAMVMLSLADCIANKTAVLQKEAQHANEVLLPMAGAMLGLSLVISGSLPWAKSVVRQETAHKKDCPFDLRKI